MGYCCCCGGGGRSCACLAARLSSSCWNAAAAPPARIDGATTANDDGNDDAAQTPCPPTPPARPSVLACSFLPAPRPRPQAPSCKVPASGQHAVTGGRGGIRARLYMDRRRAGRVVRVRVVRLLLPAAAWVCALVVAASQGATAPTKNLAVVAILPSAQKDPGMRGCLLVFAESVVRCVPRGRLAHVCFTSRPFTSPLNNRSKTTACNRPRRRLCDRLRNCLRLRPPRLLFCVVSRTHDRRLGTSRPPSRRA